MTKKTIRDIEVKGKVCLMRVDFNVSLDAAGNIIDDQRIRASLSTIYNLLGRGAKLILLSHLGRPKSKDPKTSLRIVADRLAQYIQQETICIADLDDETTTNTCINNLQEGELMFFENVRWYAGEANNPDEFGKHLASFGDVFINDGFGVCHREQASVIGIPKYLPSVAGLLLEEEIKYMELTVCSKKITRPFVAVIGGKKAEEKIGVTKALLKKADDVLLGGGVVNTFLKAQGYEIGTSFYEPDLVDTVKDIMRSAMNKRCGLVVPKDFVIADKIGADAEYEVAEYNNLPANKMTVDIGPRTRKKYEKILRNAGFILWIGPMGVYEIPACKGGNDAIMDAVAHSGANSFLGGGDTIASVANHPLKHAVAHFSTGGGATLRYLEHGTLPGIDALDDYAL